MEVMDSVFNICVGASIHYAIATNPFVPSSLLRHRAIMAAFIIRHSQISVLQRAS